MNYKLTRFKQKKGLNKLPKKILIKQILLFNN